jgi:uncharacterized protein (TIGR03000 family)
MYATVLMLALVSSAESIDHGCRGCSYCYGYYAGCSCYAGYGYGCYGCYGYRYGECCGGTYQTGYYFGAYGPANYYAYNPNYPGPTFTYGSKTAPSMMAQGPMTPSRNSFYSGPGSRGAVVRVMVPNPDAEIWFDNTATKQRGTERLFESPPLDANSTYSYTIKAKWIDSGRTVERERQVQVQSGQPVMVDFRMSPAENLNPPKGSAQKKPSKLDD